MIVSATTRLSAAVATAAAGLLLGCVSAVPRVDAGLLRIAREGQLDTGTTTLQAGYEAYRGRCSGCHQRVPPGDQSVDTWPVVIADHRERLDLEDREAARIMLYLQAGRLAKERTMHPANPPDADLIYH